jgi:hypothetical protein
MKLSHVSPKKKSLNYYSISKKGTKFYNISKVRFQGPITVTKLGLYKDLCHSLFSLTQWTLLWDLPKCLWVNAHLLSIFLSLMEEQTLLYYIFTFTFPLVKPQYVILLRHEKSIIRERNQKMHKRRSIIWYLFL